MFQLLIVDDEEAAVEALAVSLPMKELEIEAVHKAYSCEEALGILKRQTIHIVITDIQMPEDDGLVLIEQITAKWKHVKCIIMSGHAEFAYAKDGIRFGIEEYLLKPIDDDDLFGVIRRVQEKMKAEWEAYRSQQQITKTLKEHLPMLKNGLLQELIEGRTYTQPQLSEKLEGLDIPFVCGGTASLMLIRLEEGFSEYGVNSLALFEYAISNMTGEIFDEAFHIWPCRDRHDHLIIAVRENEESKEGRQEVLERLSLQLQQSVKNYLNGQISMVVGRWGEFPWDIHDIYEELMTSVRKRVGGESGFYLTVEDATDVVQVKTMKALYEPPLLMHLLESSRFAAAEAKVGQIFDELSRDFTESQEHLREAFYGIYAAYSHLAHKNGKALSVVLDEGGEAVLPGSDMLYIRVCRDWSLKALTYLKKDMEAETKQSRDSIVEKVQGFIETHLANDVSLQAIADHVYLHPVYMSKVYKAETGESVSDYLFRLRMDKAAHLLKTGYEKVYEIAGHLGYRSTPYFIKIFRDHYGMTPQDYREAYAEKHRDRES